MSKKLIELKVSDFTPVESNYTRTVNTLKIYPFMKNNAKKIQLIASNIVANPGKYTFDVGIKGNLKMYFMASYPGATPINLTQIANRITIVIPPDVNKPFDIGIYSFDVITNLVVIGGINVVCLEEFPKSRAKVVNPPVVNNIQPKQESVNKSRTVFIDKPVIVNQQQTEQYSEQEHTDNKPKSINTEQKESVHRLWDTMLAQQESKLDINIQPKFPDNLEDIAYQSLQMQKTFIQKYLEDYVQKYIKEQFSDNIVNTVCEKCKTSSFAKTEDSRECIKCSDSPKKTPKQQNVSNQQLPQVNVQPTIIKTKNPPKIPPKPPVSSKKNVLLVADSKGWCFDNISKMVSKHYCDKYNIVTTYSQENPTFLFPTIPDFDVVIKLWYGYDYYDPFDIYRNSRKIVCIYDYVHWNKNMSETNSSIYNNFVKNVGKSDIIMYSCSAIKNILLEQHKKLVAGKKMIEAFDGVDIDKFRCVKPIEEYGKKLIVGWVGNTNIPCKRFKQLNEILKGISWIDFSIQSSNNPIPHDKMFEFYNSVDVIVCSSEAEGTPNPILEASACGRTWVSTRVGIVECLNNLSESDSGCGYIIDNLDDLVLTLQTLHLDRNLLMIMGETAKETVIRHFNWNDRIKSFEKAIDG